MNEMEIIEFENLPSNKTPINSVNLNKLQTNAKEAIKNRKPTIELLTVSSSAPTECNIGDKYYNTTTSKIYTATAENTWGTEGENPTSLYLYVDLEHKELYYFNGTTFVSYGGGSGGAGGDTLPIGAVIRWDSDVLPKSGEWLWLDTEYKETDYPELAEFCGGRFNLETTPTGYFRTPKSSGLVGVGKDINDTDFDTLGKTGGEKTHTLTRAEMPTHEHDVIGSVNTTSGGQRYYIMQNVGISDNQSGTIGTSTTSGGGQPHNNLQPYIVTNYIIKAKNTVVVKGEVIQETGTASETNVYSSVAMDNKLKTNIVTGQEVATNEYVDGKQVFVKKIDIGALPNATTSKIATGLSNVTIVKPVFGYATHSNGTTINLPHLAINNLNACVGLNYTAANEIDINTGSDRSDFTGYVEVYYTKK